MNTKITNENLNWPKEGLEPVKRCPVCDSLKRKNIYHDLEDVVFFTAPGKWNFYLCSQCGVGYLDPRPSPDFIHLAYRDYYTHEQIPEFSNLSLKKKMRRIITNGYRNRVYGTNDKPAFPPGYYLVKSVPTYRAIIDNAMRNLPGNGKGKKLLDVGCGNGAFLLRAKSAGWEVTGVDFDQQAVQNGREKGLDIHHGDINVLNPISNYYDVITLAHVLEHVPDQLLLLNHCRRLLKPGGLLWLDTPNLSSTGHLIYGRHWRGLEVPRHLVIFTPDSLRKLLKKSGFSDIKFQPFVSLCKMIFSASSEIARGGDPYKFPNFLKIPDGLSLTKAERIAKFLPEKREFITLSAIKHSGELI